MDAIAGQNMLDAASARTLLEEIGREMASRGITAEIAIYGGVAMLLQFGSRHATRDIDFTMVSRDSKELRGIAARVGRRHNMPDGWFNDSVRMFVSHDPQLTPFGDFPSDGGRVGLRVVMASPHYLLAMKMLSMRSSLETHDVQDVWNLLGECGIGDAETAIGWLRRFYPGETMPADKEARLRDLVADREAGRAYDPMRYW